jgi:FlaA1/EpsC-like NDP-sugar epimerase
MYQITTHNKDTHIILTYCVACVLQHHKTKAAFKSYPTICKLITQVKVIKCFIFLHMYRASFSFCTMTNKCTIISQFCEIIVHLLVIAPNKKSTVFFVVAFSYVSFGSPVTK